MCLILFGYKVSNQYPLILAANRDEFYKRPTAPLHFWESNPSILAGKDLEQGGTWFGINKNLRFAALTNFRDPASIRQSAPSRGEIIVDFLESKKTVRPYFDNFKKTAGSYNGFNLLFGDKEDLFWFSNLKNEIEKVEPGIHGLSNRFLDTPWPKVVSGKKVLRKIVSESIMDATLTPESLFSLLTDQSVVDDALLPDTGIGLEWERILSPLFIQSDIYGTRSSTLMLVDQEGNIKVFERTYDPQDKLAYEDQEFSIIA